MATRATYEFKEGKKSLATVYIHHDGYPEGAAAYFRNALSGDGITAASFIRMNDRAEVTTKHADHEDTEFRYTLKDNESLVVSARSGDVWKETFKGSLVDFMKKYNQV